MNETKGGPQIFVIGLGSGRSGTVSLSTLLDAQRATSVTHETRPLLPWIPDEEQLSVRLAQLAHRDASISGDVAYYYLPYVERINHRLPGVKFVCMRRNFDDTVRSLMAKTDGRNHWVDHDGSLWRTDDQWDKTMPSFQVMPKIEAVRRYVSEYYIEAERLQRQLPRAFRIFDIEMLNNPRGTVSILTHIGITDPVTLQVHENRLLS